MKMFIEKESTVEDVKKIFTTCYPYLKIELYKKPYKSNRSATQKEPLPINLYRNQFIHETSKSIIDINNDITVASLENQFRDIGVVSEVFRKSGNVWVETSLTNNWTLHQQNAEGEEISKHFSIKKVDSSNHN